MVIDDKMIFVIRRKKDKLFYTKYKWVREIEKAKLFKRKRDLFLFLNSYTKKGLFSIKERLPEITKINELNIMGVELTITTIQKKVFDEYKNKQIIEELEKGNKNEN